jgi:TrpR-related protein YerC/YecD
MTYRPKYANNETDLLFKAIGALGSDEEYYRFFEDLCTINELLALAQRFTIAKMLSEDRTYQYIEEKTGASTATISRINRFLKYGADGYSVALGKLKADEACQAGEAK